MYAQYFITFDVDASVLAWVFCELNAAIWFGPITESSSYLYGASLCRLWPSGEVAPYLMQMRLIPTDAQLGSRMGDGGGASRGEGGEGGGQRRRHRPGMRRRRSRSGCDSGVPSTCLAGRCRSRAHTRCAAGTSPRCLRRLAGQIGHRCMLLGQGVAAMTLLTFCQPQPGIGPAAHAVHLDCRALHSGMVTEGDPFFPTSVDEGHPPLAR